MAPHARRPFYYASERLVRGRRRGADRGAVRALRHVQYTACVAREIGGTHHRGVLPQGKLVLRVAVRRDNLLRMRRPLERADLSIGYTTLL